MKIKIFYSDLTHNELDRIQTEIMDFLKKVEFVQMHQSVCTATLVITIVYKKKSNG